MVGKPCNGRYVDPKVLEHTPVGRDNAMSALDIWKAMSCWAPVTVRQRLFALAQDGLIHYHNKPLYAHTKTRYVYWKE